MHFVNCNAHHKIVVTVVQPSESSAIVRESAAAAIPNLFPRAKTLLTKEAGMICVSLRYTCAAGNALDATKLLGIQRLMSGLNSNAEIHLKLDRMSTDCVTEGLIHISFCLI